MDIFNKNIFNRNNLAGFGLVELMITVFILSIFISSFMYFSNNVTKIAHKILIQQQSLQLIENQKNLLLLNKPCQTSLVLNDIDFQIKCSISPSGHKIEVEANSIKVSLVL